MSKLSATITLLVGIAIGGAAAWYVARERYAQLAEEEINSIKETYARMERKKMKDLGKEFADGIKEGLEEGEKTPAVTTKVQNKGSIAEYAERIKNGAPMDYAKTVVPQKQEVPIESAQYDSASEQIYVISPEEFGELDTYTKISLTCFDDYVLADEHGVIIENVEEIVGDALNHIGEYEDDSVFVRNNVLHCDYEILCDEREYAVFRATLPSNI